MIEKKLDVRTLLFSMMELEKLKLLLFDPDQYFLFQHLPKPILFDKFIYKAKKILDVTKKQWKLIQENQLELQLISL